MSPPSPEADPDIEALLSHEIVVAIVDELGVSGLTELYYLSREPHALPVLRALSSCPDTVRQTLAAFLSKAVGHPGSLQAEQAGPITLVIRLS